MTKKTIFVFPVDNVINLITNSSSELFILEAETKEIVSELISQAYPNYLSEYEEVKEGSELSNKELNTYVSYASHNWDSYKTLSYSSFLGIEPADLYEDYENRFKIKEEKRWYSANISEYGFGLLREKLKGVWFLFSTDENPNYEHQESLERIAQRYHLG